MLAQIKGKHGKALLLSTYCSVNPGLIFILSILNIPVN